MDSSSLRICCWIGTRGQIPCNRPAEWVVTPLPQPGVPSYDTHVECCNKHLPLLSVPEDDVSPISS